MEEGLLWAGSDDGLINVSKDGGKNWENVSPPQAGKFMMWNCVETNPFKKGAAYFVGTKYKLDDFKPYIFKTEDYGKTWKQITNGIDSMHFTRTLRADRKIPGLLYAGTEYGMYISYDDGEHWKKFQLNLPPVPVTDLTIKDNDLIVATQGRAFWSLDDLSIIQQRSADILTKGLYVLGVNDAYRMEGSSNPDVHNAGFNPPNGVVFNYFLREAPDSADITIRIFDKQHLLIKTFNKAAKEKADKPVFAKGMNRFVWDMQYPPAEKIDGMVLWNGSPDGPKAAPGKYTARFIYGKDSLDVPFAIKGDPNYAVSEEDYDKQVGFLLQVRDKFSAIQKAIENIRNMRGQIDAVVAKADTATTKDLKQLGDSINKQFTAIEEALDQTKAKSGEDVLNFPIRLNDRIAAVYNVASAGYGAPSKQALEAFANLSALTDAQLNKFKSVLANEVQAFNKLIYQKQVPVVGIKD